MRRLLLLFLLTALSFAQVKTNVNEEKIMEKFRELQKKGVLSKETLKRIEEYKSKVKPLVRSIERRALKKENEGKGIVENHRLYVFMSSSVPKEVWYEYVRQAVKERINAVFLLRGCIGGCRYIKPTLAFIRDVLTLGGQKENGLPVEIWIDPLKFREYGVSVVPCFAYEGEKKLSCGDWSLKWHLKKLREK